MRRLKLNSPSVAVRPPSCSPCAFPLATAASNHHAQATNINMNILWTAASLVLTRCFAVYTQAQTQRTMMQQQMTSSLYDKMQDSQEGVISVITEVRRGCTVGNSVLAGNRQGCARQFACSLPYVSGCVPLILPALAAVTAQAAST